MKSLKMQEDGRIYREYAKEYVSKCRLRVLRHIPDNGLNILDMASGPIQYKEYLEYSKNFKKRYCVDLSSVALEMARKKIWDHGAFLHGSFFNIPMGENFFDCAVSLHTPYYIDKDMQEEAVRKLLYVAKPGRPVIIVYSNPNTFGTLPYRLLRRSLPLHLLKIVKSILKKNQNKKEQEENISLYFHPHPIEWWNRFSDIANVNILPWRSFTSDTQKRLIPNNKMCRKMFDALFSLEERFPDFFAKHFQYPMIILAKNEN